MGVGRAHRMGCREGAPHGCGEGTPHGCGEGALHGCGEGTPHARPANAEPSNNLKTSSHLNSKKSG